MDRAGFEGHFIRFLYLALFEGEEEEMSFGNNESPHTTEQIFDLISFDNALLYGIIMPLFIVAMHFYTAPFKKKYRNKVQILLLPLAFVPLFNYTNIDIAIMGAIVLV